MVDTNPPFIFFMGKSGNININFEEEYDTASAEIYLNLVARATNKEHRYHLYHRVWQFLAPKKQTSGKSPRIQLPNCVMAKIRQCYPEQLGIYIGFIEKLADVNIDYD